MSMAGRSRTASLLISSVVGVGIIGALYYLWGVENKKLFVTNGTSADKVSLFTKPRRSLTVKKELTIEVCVSDIQSVRESIAGGCNSIELCCNRLEGGVTPSVGLIEQAATVIGGRDIALHVLIRPRPGGFVYSDDELDIIQRDITAAKLAGADGIVFGALDSDGKIDKSRVKLVRQLSKGMILTFHRAFDVCTEEQDAALETVIALGCDRLLTSAGPQSDVSHNLDALASLQKQAKGRVVVVAAAGITADNVQNVMHRSGVRAVHAGSSVTSEVTLATRGANPGAEMLSPASGKLVGASSKTEEGRESFVEVDASPLETPDPKAALVKELVSWSCTQEALVHELVIQATLAISSRSGEARSPDTAAQGEGSGLDSSYIHL